MFDINGSKTKLDQESLFSSDHIEYWKCNIPVTQDQHHLKYNIKGFQGIKNLCYCYWIVPLRDQSSAKFREAGNEK